MSAEDLGLPDTVTIEPKDITEDMINDLNGDYNDSITALLSNSLKKFYNKKRTYLERAKTSSQKIIKEGIIFEYKQHFLFNLISGDTLDIKKNTYYSDVYKCFDSLATNNGWNRIAIVFWDLTYTSATK